MEELKPKIPEFIKKLQQMSEEIFKQMRKENDKTDELTQDNVVEILGYMEGLSTDELMNLSTIILNLVPESYNKSLILWQITVRMHKHIQKSDETINILLKEIETKLKRLIPKP